MALDVDLDEGVDGVGHIPVVLNPDRPAIADEVAPQDRPDILTQPWRIAVEMGVRSLPSGRRFVRNTRACRHTLFTCQRTREKR